MNYYMNVTNITNENACWIRLLKKMFCVHREQNLNLLFLKTFFFKLK